MVQPFDTQQLREPQKRLLTGDRPTGRLHLGNLVGSLQNRVRLQNEFDTILIIADLHMLTTRNSREDIREIGQNVRSLVIDYLAAGIDPERVTIYLQSAVPEVYELNTLLQNLVTVSRLSRLPSIKEMARDIHIDARSLPYGLLGYPVLQAADILLAKTNLVPVGKDNLAHVEITREIAERFNKLYGHVFPLPEPLLGDVPTLVGIDGKGKMSKSAGNAIFLSDPPNVLAKKIRSMYTDPRRIHAHIPGKIEGNPIFVYHDAFNEDKEEVETLKDRYREGAVGDAEVKDRLLTALNAYLEPIWNRMAYFEHRTGLVEEVVWNGTARMRQIAKETMSGVRRAMGIDRALGKIRRKVEERHSRETSDGEGTPPLASHHSGGL